MRVAAFIDGFNFYHALDESGQQHFKWVNLRTLCAAFAPAPQFDLAHVFYFSAYATWRPDAFARHRAYVQALRVVGITPILGKFKEKFRACRNCGARWTDHEEKETDVNLALYLVSAAFKDLYDRALLITGDSDICPAVRFVRAEFPAKQVRIIAPLGRAYSMDLVNAAGGLASARRMKRIHLERALLPAQVRDSHGAIVASRPPKYDPPAGHHR